MTGSFSAHLMSSYSAAMQSPFAARSATPGSSSSHINPQICGPMSFAPSMHGTPYPSSMSQAGPSGSLFSSTFLPNFATPSEISEATAKRIATLQAKLDQKLGPEFISQRPGPGGAGKLTYAEGWKIINLANEIFGFNGWSSSIVNLTTDFVDYNEESRRFSVAATAIVRVTLADGVYHEDVGCGQVENVKSKAAAIDKCKKEAVTDAVKRALRNFGNVLGNCLYDKSYATEVVKMKVPMVKFDKSQLYRRPEFQEPTVPASASSADTNSSMTVSNNVKSPMNVDHNSSPMDIKPPLSRTDNLLSKPQPLARPVRPVPNVPLQSRQNTGGSSSASGYSSRTTPTHPHPPNSKANGNTNMQNTTTKASTSNTNTNSTITTNHNKAMELSTTTATTGAAMELDKDESFTMSSEDDALFASVNMSEVDLGRPIYYDDSAIVAGAEEENAVGDESAFVIPPPPGQHQQQARKDSAAIGRSVNSGAGGVTNVSTSTAAVEDGRAIPGRPPAPQSRVMAVQPPRDAAAIAKRLQLFNQMLKEGDPSLSSSSSSSEVKGISSSEVGSSSSSNDNKKSALSSSSTIAVSATGHHTNYHGSGSNHHQSSGVGLSASASSSSSSGGFYYTEGANAQRLNGNSNSDSNGSGIGMKRPADAIQPQTAPKHAAGPGMGLLQQVQNGGGGGGQQHNHHHLASSTAAANRRQPLGQLDIAPGGDIKRVKR